MVFFAVLFSRLNGAQAECPTIVLIESDPSTKSDVEAQLQGLEIETKPLGDCGSWLATIEKRANGYSLLVTSASGAEYLRNVSSLETIVTLIDTQVRDTTIHPLDDIENTEPASEPASPTIETPKTNEPSDKATAEQSESVVAPKTSAKTPKQRQFHIQLLFEAAFAYDRTFWMGPKLAGCAEIGSFCLGAQIRYAGDSNLTGGDTARDTNRILLDGALSAQLPITWGIVTLSPGVNIGAGYYSTWSPDGTPLGQHGGFRIDATLALAVAVTPKLLVEVIGICAGLSVPVHEDRQAQTENVDAYTIPEPRGFLRGGIGIRYLVPYRHRTRRS
jgi:hypothetical protein